MGKTKDKRRKKRATDVEYADEIGLADRVRERMTDTDISRPTRDDPRMFKVEDADVDPRMFRVEEGHSLMDSLKDDVGAVSDRWDSAKEKHMRRVEDAGEADPRYTPEEKARLIRKFRESRKPDVDHMPSIEEASKAIKGGVRESLDEWMLKKNDNDMIQEYVKPGVAAVADAAADMTYPESAGEAAMGVMPLGKLGKLSKASKTVSRSDALGQVRKKIRDLDTKLVDKRLEGEISLPIDKMLPSEKREILEHVVMKDDAKVMELIKASRERMNAVDKAEAAMPSQRSIYE